MATTYIITQTPTANTSTSCAHDKITKSKSKEMRKKGINVHNKYVITPKTKNEKQNIN